MCYNEKVNLCITETLLLPDFGLSEIWVSTLVTLTIFIGQSIGGIHEMNDVIRMVLVCVSGVLPKRFFILSVSVCAAHAEVRILPTSNIRATYL